MTARGWFVSFEGGEGAGKSTQIDRLTEALTERGQAPVCVREPGGTALGEHVRRILLDPDDGPRSERSELLLYLASRAELTETVIRPALADGRVVIADRYVDASVAYQGGGRALGAETVTELNAFATGGLVPDVTFLLDIDPEAGLARVARRGTPDRLEREALAFHRRVRAAYLDLVDGERVVRLDATEPPDALFRRIWADLSGRMGA